MYKKKLQLCTLGYAERKIPSGENQNPARRRLQPASDIKAKLQLCTLGYTERSYLMLFDDRHRLPALHARLRRAKNPVRRGFNIQASDPVFGDYIQD
jgi:hypothetical protein